MFNQSEYIYSLLNVASITNLATGGVFPLLAEQETNEFVTYNINVNNNQAKDNRTYYVVTINCYSNSYDDALKINDAVQTVLEANNIWMIDAESRYVDETNEANVKSTFTYKR